MQDSIEDYIKIAGVGKDTKLTFDNEKLANIKATVDAKKQAELYAQSIVEFLIDGKLRSKIFLKSLNCINSALYDDVVDERAISKLCGYPICGKQIPDMPEKKFIILSKVNKVYDLTDRKKFCSNFCYKASNHIKAQIDNSPLWLRTRENALEFNLLSNSNTGLEPGEELGHGVKAPNDDDQTTFTSVTAFTEACLDEAEENLPEKDVATDKNDAESLDIIKSILKQKSQEGKLEKIDETIENEVNHEPQPSTSKDFKTDSNKKVHFIDNSLKEKEELKNSIQNICKSLNINLNLEEESPLPKTNPKTNEEIKTNIQIDQDKINKVIQKVNESEKQRNKPLRLIDTQVNPEVTHPSLEKLRSLEVPKYSQRIAEISKHRKAASNEDMNVLIEKVKNIELNKKQNTQKQKRPDDKMLQILQKLKNKNTNEKKGVIMVETVDNPEVHRSHVEEIVKKSSETSLRLKENEWKEILNAFHKWLTIDSFVFLHGEDKVRETLRNEQIDSHFNKIKVAELEESQQVKYIEICKRLQLKEFQEQSFDSGCLSELNRGLKPLPDFNKLKEELETTTIKAQAFYSGQIVVRDKNSSEQENQVVLPLVDVSNATALRRGVFMKSVLQYVQNHLQELSVPESTLSKVQDLIKTCKFEANNVVFKPTQWNIIALCLINCLKMVEPTLRSEKSSEYFATWSKKIGDFNLLEEIHSLVENFDQFVEDHILGK